MRPARLGLHVLVVLSMTATLAAQPSAATGAARLRFLFFQRDFATAVIEGEKLVAKSPNAAELKAWFVLNVVRGGDEKRAVALAEEMTTKKAQYAWSWFALAGALNYQRERPADAVAAGEKALTLLPGNADVIWIRAQTLANDEKRRDEAIAFVDGQRARVRNPAEILVTKGYALYMQSSGAARDEAKLKAALASFEEARQVDPTNLGAWYLPGSYLSGLRRSDEAYPLLKKAVELSPNSTDVHQALWRAINGSREFGADRKQQEVKTDVDAFLKAQGDRPAALYAVAMISRDMKWTDRQQETEEKILKDFPASVESEWVTAYRWRDLGSTMESAQSPEYRRILRDFVARPQHHLEGLLGEAYRNYFGVLSADKSSSGDELYRAAEGALKYETINPRVTWVGTALALADRKVHLADAERIARESIGVLKKKIDSQRSSYETPVEYERAVNWFTAMGHDALGWVLLAEGRTADAEKELLAAFELDPRSRSNLDHLGRYYLATKDETKAEDYFVKGLGVQAVGTNPCEASLRSLYEKRRGSLGGFDEYLSGLKDADRAKRKERVLAERVSAPAAVLPFNLKTLDGQPVSLDSLKGKMVVINFWGIWCGWCVRELPDYQKLFAKYAGDTGVVILTINNDRNPDDVPPWVAQKKYTFPVLIDDGYVDKVPLNTFPTTWFLDQQGRRVFEKIGWSEQLLEEFSWRIDAIRAARPPS
ncbi:MAG: redoxin domain-containing protein [Acidobacteria bacterium]|nr:redoxin domain-containing protein [Acidobacteriota bacterium]